MDSTTTGLATSTLGGLKFKIQQSIPSGSVKRGPHAIVRSADLNDGIEIKRRFGEGSKPLFHDITVNQPTTEGRDTSYSGHDNILSCKSKLNRRSSSSESSSPERYRHRENKKQSSPSRQKSPGRPSCSDRPNHNRDKHNSKHRISKTDKYKRREKSKSRSPLPVKKKPAEKVPYYRDEQREKDRLRRLYGCSRSRSPSPSRGKKHSPISKRRLESPPRRRRSTSREPNRRHSPYRSSRRDYKIRRSRTPSRTRSPQKRERHKHSSRSSKDRDKGQKEDTNPLTTAVIPATPQYIPIPVAVPADYAAYSFGWTAPQPPWHPSPHRPPSASHFAPFPMWPLIPPMRPPHQAPYIGMPPALPYTPMSVQYRPHGSQRYPPPRHNTNSYQSRPKKPTS